MTLFVEPHFIIASPPYNVNSGGVIQLFELCRLINEIGTAYMVPAPIGLIVNFLNTNALDNIRLIQEHQKQFSMPKDMEKWFFRGDLNQDNLVVVYPEIVHGNPFQKKHVARWLLYHAGELRNEIALGRGEVQFRYNSNYVAAEIPGFVEISDIELYVNVPPNDAYLELKSSINISMEEIHQTKSGVAYLVKKGVFTDHPMIDNLSIKLDGLERSSVIKTLKDVKYFISFDPDTFYSEIAAALGCISIIVPQKNSPNKAERPWLAINDQDIESAWNARRELLESWEKSRGVSRGNVKHFVDFWRNRINKTE
jgi:hypothetical protein